METQLNSIHGAAGAAVALIPGLLWHLSGRGFRMANSGEELLDLFEERYCVPQERVLQKGVTRLPRRDYLIAADGSRQSANSGV